MRRPRFTFISEGNPLRRSKDCVDFNIIRIERVIKSGREIEGEFQQPVSGNLCVIWPGRAQLERFFTRKGIVRLRRVNGIEKARNQNAAEHREFAQSHRARVSKKSRPGNV